MERSHPADSISPEVVGGKKTTLALMRPRIQDATKPGCLPPQTSIKKNKQTNKQYNTWSLGITQIMVFYFCESMDSTGRRVQI